MTSTMFDLSGFQGLPYSLKLKYESYWNTYNRIQTFNVEVSTLRNGGDKTATYYQYVSYAEKDAFVNGQSLHIKRYPTSNWTPVSED